VPLQNGSIRQFFHETQSKLRIFDSVKEVWGLVGFASHAKEQGLVRRRCILVVVQFFMIMNDPYFLLLPLTLL
jgi:hypothetical protein